MRWMASDTLCVSQTFADALFEYVRIQCIIVYHLNCVELFWAIQTGEDPRYEHCARPVQMAASRPAANDLTWSSHDSRWPNFKSWSLDLNWFELREFISLSNIVSDSGLNEVGQACSAYSREFNVQVWMGSCIWLDLIYSDHEISDTYSRP